jgi:hypothetical protein
MKQKVSIEGLKVRPSYDELINQLDKPVVDKYPDRKASQLRNSHWLSQLDGDSFRAMDELLHNMLKEHDKEAVLKGCASSHHTSLSSLRVHHLAPSQYGNPGPATPQQFNFATPPQSPRQSQTQYYNLTPPQSPRQKPAPPVFPSAQPHYAHIPNPPKQSATRKVKNTIEKKTHKKFERMADDEFDNKVKEQHDMNVDDAELLQQQADRKR